MANPKVRSYLGIAKEASRTAGVDPTPVNATDFIPVESINPIDDITMLDDNNWRGSMVEIYGTQQGVKISTFEFGGSVFADSIGYALAGVLGDVATSGATAPYTHTMAVKNSGTGQCTSYTLTDYNAYNARQFAGMQFGEVGLKFSADGLLEYTAKATGYASAVATTPTPSFSTVIPTPVWVGTTTIAGSLITRLQSGDVNLKRTLTPVYTVDGTQSPYQVWQGALAVDGSLTLVMEDDTDLNYYLNNTQPSLALDWSVGAGSTATQLKLQMTKCAFKTGKVTRGKDYVEVEVSFSAIANTTDIGATSGYSPIKVTLKNAKASGTYA